MEEIKRLASLMGVPITMVPDTSGVLNAPLTGQFTLFPKGGVTVEELQATGRAKATVALGEWCSAEAARWLDAQCKVPCTIIEMPYGLLGTDRFIDALRVAGGVAVPESIEFERGQLVDFIADMHQYFYGKKVALVGDPDQLIAMTDFLVSIDMHPVHIVTGTPGSRFEKRIQEIVAPLGYTPNVRAGGDMFLFHQWIKNDPVDVIIGNTYCKYISRDEDIPLLRFGFPILDRVGHQYFPTVGYKGGLLFLTRLLDVLLTRKDRDEPESSFELVY